MKKVLIITYYWPPSGSSAVQRVLKFSKYLPEFGWQPIILTVNSGQYNALDKSFEDEIPDSEKIYRTKAIESHTWYKLFTGTKNIIKAHKADFKLPYILFLLGLSIFLKYLALLIKKLEQKK